MTTESAAIEPRNLTKRFGDVLAVDAVWALGFALAVQRCYAGTFYYQAD